MLRFVCVAFLKLLALLFFSVFVRFPDHGLLVVESFLGLFTSLFLVHLASKEQTHLVLFLTFAFHAALIFKTLPHFLLLFKSEDRKSVV